MNLANLWTVWPIPGPWKLSPTVGGGTSNQVWRVDAADGQSYILRLTPDLTRIPGIQYETAVLQTLSDKGLPFRLPLPLKTRNGDIVMLVEQDTGTPACATLYPLLPGSLPEHNLASISSAGLALAQLDEALVTLPEIQHPEGFVAPPPFGELSRCHPLVPDPLAAIDQLPIGREQASNVCTFLSNVIASVPPLYSQLPQQLVHRDCGPENILMDQQCVAAILDFEAMGRDIRVLDICVALSWWPRRLLGTGKEWDVINTFGRAYTRHLALREDELLAIPDVWRLRLADVFVYRMGRYLSSPHSGIDMQDQAKRTLWTNRWLSDHRETLLSHILTWH
jgi:Ser/Thr protein kinase RdoA (MazF antagonist)